MRSGASGQAPAPDSLRKIGRLAGVAAVLTAGLITYGAFVRVSGSGLGCPDWPLCHGSVVPDLERSTAIEFGHRLFAGVTIIVVAVTAGLAFQKRRVAGPAARLLVGALGVILAQAVLGGITVLTELNELIVVAHLIFAMATLGLLAAAAELLLGRPVADGRTPAAGVALLAAAVVLLGGAIVGTGASALCPELPFCSASSVGEANTSAALLHALHRVLAVALFLVLALTALRLRRRGERVGAYGLLASLAALQIGVGVSNVVLDLPGALRVLHLGIATLLWGGLVVRWVAAGGLGGPAVIALRPTEGAA